MTKAVMVLLAFCILSGCTECPPKPDRQFFKGQHVIYLPTQERVRVVSLWVPLSNRCQPRHTETYTIRFQDGTEFTAKWTELKEREDG